MLTRIQQWAVNGIIFNFKMLTEKKSPIENCRATSAHWQWIKEAKKKKTTDSFAAEQAIHTMQQKKKKKSEKTPEQTKPTSKLFYVQTIDGDR